MTTANRLLRRTSLPRHRFLLAALSLSLAWALVVACGQSEPANTGLDAATPNPTLTEQGPQNQPSQPANPSTSELPSATPTMEARPNGPTQHVTSVMPGGPESNPSTTELLIPTPTPVIQEHLPPRHWGASGPYLDNSIFWADTIVWAQLLSNASASQTIPSGESSRRTGP